MGFDARGGVHPNVTVPPVAGLGVFECGVLRGLSGALHGDTSAALGDLEGVLPELPEACRKLAETFHSESPESGFEPFQQFAHIWKTIKERELHIVGALGIDVDELEIDGQPIGPMHDELNKFLDEAAEALKNNDCVLLGDLLEYEMAPKAEKEIEIVAMLRSRAQKICG